MSSSVSDLPVHGLELEGDLASLACIAAAELDNLIRGHSKGLVATQRVAARVLELTEMPGAATVFRLDPTAAGTLRGAIEHSGLGRPAKVDELIDQAQQISTMVTELAANPASYAQAKKDNCIRLKAFFLALSQAASVDWSVAALETEHPYRR